MLPNEILPAIPRQKVKNSDGRTMTVLHYSRSEKFVYGIVDGDARTDDISGWELKDCEPVPEEPRPFRCGDAVWASGDGQPFFARVEAVSEDGKRIRVNRYNFEATEIRHATPSEVAQYFN